MTDPRELKPVEHHCSCGATLLVFRQLGCIPLPTDAPSEFITRSALTITRRFTHEGSGVITACFAHLRQVRTDYSDIDLATLRKLSKQLEEGEHDSDDNRRSN